MEIELRLGFEKAIERISGGKLPARGIEGLRKLLVFPRNAAKHFKSPNESQCDFDARLESALMLSRALVNWKLVFPEAAEDLEDAEEMLGIDILNINLRTLRQDA